MINLGFWNELKKKKQPTGDPIIALAPMADVTDAAFRRIIAKYSRMGEQGGGPDVLWTEFVSADGLFLAPPEGRAKLMKDLIFTEAERPIVAQFFSSRPEMMERAAYLAAELGFDGVDINMGCPDRSIEKQGAGAAHMKNAARAQEVIRAAKAGVERYAKEKSTKPIPVSVKTRIGYSKNELKTWLPALLEAEPAVVTIHARTRKEMSKVPARWEHIREAVAIRDAFFANTAAAEKTLIFGNGDVAGLSDAREKAVQTSADGVMLGRAIFGNPWLFDSARSPSDISIQEKLRVLVEHTKLYEQLLGDTKSFAIMKKHYKAYVNGFDGAAALRARLMETQLAGEVEAVVAQDGKNFS